MDIVKCKRCGNQIDKRIDKFVKLSSGYAHEECEQQFQIKRNTVICQICRCGVNKLTDEYEKRASGYVHTKCISSDEKDKLELYGYINELFHLKAPGPANLTLIKKFHTENGYSYKSIYYTLKYYYEVKHNSTTKAQSRIGIVPYVYDEAKEYYDNITRTQTAVLKSVEKQLSQEESIIVVKSAPHRKKKTIDLGDLN